MKRMKKVLRLLSLLAAFSSIAMASSQTRVEAILDVVDPTAEVSLNVSSTAMAFGDQIIKAGTITSPEKIQVKLEGDNAAQALLRVPKQIELTSGDGDSVAKINLQTLLTSTDGTISETGANYEFITASELTTGTEATAELVGKITLLGTEIAGVYTGTINMNATYN